MSRHLGGACRMTYSPCCGYCGRVTDLPSCRVRLDREGALLAYRSRWKWWAEIRSLCRM